MKALRILPIALVVAGLGGSGFWAWRTYGQADTDGPLRLYGNVDIRQVDLAFNAEGKIAEIRVEEGDRVDEGELLARLV